MHRHVAGVLSNGATARDWQVIVTLSLPADRDDGGGARAVSQQCITGVGHTSWPPHGGSWGDVKFPWDVVLLLDGRLLGPRPKFGGDALNLMATADRAADPTFIICSNLGFIRPR
jgi:hypothetical protein